MQLNKCCFCVNLRTGGIALGVVSFLANLLSALLAFWVLSALPNDILDNLVEVIPYYVSLGVSLVAMVAAIFLIVGAKKNREGFIMPYLIVYGVSCALQVITVGLSIYQITAGLIGLANLILNVLVAAFAVYLWMCVYSLYKMIKQEKAGIQRTV